MKKKISKEGAGEKEDIQQTRKLGEREMEESFSDVRGRGCRVTVKAEDKIRIRKLIIEFVIRIESVKWREK